MAVLILSRAEAVRSVLAEIKHIPGVVETGTARDVKAALAKAINVPAVFALYDGGRSKGRTTHNTRGQNIDLDISLIVVTEDYFNEENAHLGALELLDALCDRITGFVPATCKKPLEYVRDDFVIQNGERVA